MLLFAILAIPLAAGAISFAARNRRAMEAINLGAFAALFLMAAALAAQVLRAGTVSLWNGFLAADSLSALVVLLTAFVALVCSVYAVGYFREDERNHVFFSPGNVCVSAKFVLRGAYCVFGATDAAVRVGCRAGGAAWVLFQMISITLAIGPTTNRA